MAPCSVCLDDCEIIPLKIGGDAVCLDCIKTGIIPNFHAALKHESQYPPTFGRYRLRPQDFKPWIENYDDFARQWREREFEYLTPVGIRLYCGKCGHYVCKRDPRKLIRLGCSWCSALICAACGLVDKGDTKHQCPPQATDPYEGLMRGKDYQRCPKEDCGIVVELKEACNAMRCTSASCMTQFCFICGELAAHNSDHWAAGSKCPRFNQPGSSNARFDPPAAEAQEPQPPPPPPPPPARQPPTAAAIINLLNEGLDEREEVIALLRLVENIPPLPDLPALPALPPNAAANEEDGPNLRMRHLQAEQAITPALLATEFGLLMQHQRGQLDAILQVAQAMIIDNGPNAPLPNALHVAIDLMVKLRVNLDIYVFRSRLAAGLPHFLRRHREITDGWTRMEGDMVLDVRRWFPALEDVVLVYEIVAPLRGMPNAILGPLPGVANAILGPLPGVANARLAFGGEEIEALAARWRI